MRPIVSCLFHAAIVGALLSGAEIAAALPPPPSVVAGSATFEHSAGTLTVQAGSNTIFDWQTFAIASGDTARFVQPSASNAVLNRVLSGDPTIISGDLSSNGRLYLINPAGFLITSGAHISAGSLTLSTLSLSDADFRAGIPNFGPPVGTGSIVINGGVSISGDLSLYAQVIELGGPLLTPSGPVSLPPSSGGLITTNFVGGGGSISIGQGGSLSLGGGSGDSIVTIHSPIPEPAAYALFLVGLAGLGLFARPRTD